MNENETNAHNDSAYMTREEVAALSEKFRETGDEAYRNTIVERNLALVHSAAKPFFNRMDPDDCISEGSIGLMRAAETFTLTEGTKFSVYAWKCIQTRIRRAIEEQKSNIRIPSCMQNNIREFKRAKRVIENDTGFEPTNEETVDWLMKNCTLKSQKWSHAVGQKVVQTILYGHSHGAGEGGLDELHHMKELTIEETDDGHKESEMEELRIALSELPETVRDVVVLSYQGGLKKNEIAERLGLTQTVTNTMLKNGLKQIRDKIGIFDNESEETEETPIIIKKKPIKKAMTVVAKIVFKEIPEKMLGKIYADYKGNGGKLVYTELETKYNLHPANGMTAYRAVKKHAKSLVLA